jgi:dolichol-phosphate mannosyltransferase
MSCIEIFIPAFDETRNLEVLVPELLHIIAGMPAHSFLINIVVREDESESEIEKIKNLSVNVIKRKPNNNFGSAIKTAVDSVNPDTDYVLFMDADGSHNPTRIPDLLSTILKNDVDVVVASRYIEGGKTDNPFVLILLSRLLNWIFALVIGVKCRDISTNYKIYKASILRGIFLRSSNFDVIEELLFLINSKTKSGIRILEIPDHFERRRHGDSKRKLSIFIASYFITLLKLRFRVRRENSSLWS